MSVGVMSVQDVGVVDSSSMAIDGSRPAGRFSAMLNIDARSVERS